MKNQINNSVNLGDLGPIYAGNRASYLQQDNETGDIVVPVVNWSNLYSLIHNKSYNTVTEYKMSMQKIHKRRNSMIEKGDLLFSSMPSKTGNNIIYVNRTLDKTILCGDNIYIFKNNSEYSSEYIYMVLNSGLYNKYLKHIGIANNHKLGINNLLELEIPILDNADELTAEYYKISEAKMEVIEKENNFNNKIYELAKQAIAF